MSEEFSMSLPDNKTCADCGHFKRCKWLLDREGNEDECDWYPIRFKSNSDLMKGEEK